MYYVVHRGESLILLPLSAHLPRPDRARFMRISVVIPAFNEEGNIGRLIEETFAEVPESAAWRGDRYRRRERRRNGG